MKRYFAFLKEQTADFVAYTLMPILIILALCFGVAVVIFFLLYAAVRFLL